VDVNGDVIERYHDTPYGKLSILDPNFSADDNGKSDLANPYSFTGRRSDDETGLYYFRNRYYGWHVGRFVSRDPIGYEGSEWNLYEYVGGTPLTRTDPIGKAWWNLWICDLGHKLGEWYGDWKYPISAPAPAPVYIPVRIKGKPAHWPKPPGKAGKWGLGTILTDCYPGCKDVNKQWGSDAEDSCQQCCMECEKEHKRLCNLIPNKDARKACILQARNASNGCQLGCKR